MTASPELPPRIPLARPDLGDLGEGPGIARLARGDPEEHLERGPEPVAQGRLDRARAWG